MAWVAIGSIVLNVILIVALFFKGAINDLAKEYTLDRYRERKRRRELLKQLHASIDEISWLYTRCFFSMYVALQSPVVEQRREADVTREQLTSRIQEVHRFIGENRLDFSKDLQTLIHNFQQSLLHIASQIPVLLSRPIGFDQLSEELQRALNSTVPPIKERIRAELGE